MDRAVFPCQIKLVQPATDTLLVCGLSLSGVLTDSIQGESYGSEVEQLPWSPMMYGPGRDSPYDLQDEDIMYWGLPG